MVPAPITAILRTSAMFIRLPSASGRIATTVKSPWTPRAQALDSAAPLGAYVAGAPPPRTSPYLGIFLAVVSVSWASIFITWSTSPAITIALYRLGMATLILAGVLGVRVALGKAVTLRSLPRRDLLLMAGIGAIL